MASGRFTADPDQLPAGRSRTEHRRIVRRSRGSQVAFGTPPGAIGDPCDVRSSARTGAGGASVRQLCLDQGIPTAVIDTYVFPTTATAGVLSGNPELEPETADTYNIGFQWTSDSESG
jgi:hypothetical protein